MPDVRDLTDATKHPFGEFKPVGLARLLLALSRNAPTARGYLRRLIGNHLNRHQRPCYDVEVEVTRFRLFPRDDHGARMLLLKGRGSPKEHDFIRRSLANGGTLVDAGAHIGTMSLPQARTRGVRIVAIEPNPVALARLRFNIVANDLSNVTVVAAALSDVDGMIDFDADPSNIAESAVGRGEGERIKVPSRTLASILQSEGVADFTSLKIDIQFLEDRALLPFFEDAERSRWPRHVLIESIRNLNNEPRVIGVMKDRGYREVLRTHQNVGLSLVDGHADGMV